MNKQNYSGSCLCGNIKFLAKGKPQNPHTCSCKMCQCHSGALTVSWVEFPSASVEWIGEGGTPETYRSSDFSSRAFCSKCGSTIGAIDDDPVVALVLGCFDSVKGEEFIHTKHSYKGSCPKWWKIS